MKLGELGARLRDSSRLPNISVSLSCVLVSQVSHQYCSKLLPFIRIINEYNAVLDCASNKRLK